MEQKLGTLLGLVIKNQENTRVDYEDERSRRIKANEKLLTRIKANEETTQAKLIDVHERALDMQKTVRQSEISIDRRFNDTRFMWIGFKQEVKEMVQEDMSEVIEGINGKLDNMEEDLETFRMEHNSMKKKVDARQYNRRRKAKSNEAETKKDKTKKSINENEIRQEKKEDEERNNTVETIRDFTEDKIEKHDVLKPKLHVNEYEIETSKEKPKIVSKREGNLTNFDEIRDRYNKELTLHMGALLKVLQPKEAAKSESENRDDTEDTESCSIYSSEEESELENSTL